MKLTFSRIWYNFFFLLLKIEHATDIIQSLKYQLLSIYNRKAPILCITNPILSEHNFLYRFELCNI